MDVCACPGQATAPAASAAALRGHVVGVLFFTVSTLAEEHCKGCQQKIITTRENKVWGPQQTVMSAFHLITLVCPHHKARNGQKLPEASKRDDRAPIAAPEQQHGRWPRSPLCVNQALGPNLVHRCAFVLDKGHLESRFRNRGGKAGQPRPEAVPRALRGAALADRVRPSPHKQVSVQSLASQKYPENANEQIPYADWR